jgi:hypothetical protein
MMKVYMSKHSVEVSHHFNQCRCEAVFTLDNAKFWYLKFVYDFLYKCLDMTKVRFVGDTDSMYMAVVGNPNDDCHQGFKYVIKNKEYYDKYVCV